MMSSALLLTLGLSSGCGAGVVYGSGKLSTKQIDTKRFDRVETRDFLSVEVKAGDTQTVSITCDDNLHRYFETRVESSTLVFEVKDAWSIQPHKGCLARVTAPEIKSAASFGSGDVDVDGDVKALEELSSRGSGNLRAHQVRSPRLVVRTKGSGDVFVSGDFRFLDADSQGSGDMTFETRQGEHLEARTEGSGEASFRGSTQTLVVRTHGSGDVHASDMQAENVTASSGGSGDVMIRATRFVEATSKGSGDVIVLGDPKRRQVNQYGSGDVRFE